MPARRPDRRSGSRRASRRPAYRSSARARRDRPRRGARAVLAASSTPPGLLAPRNGTAIDVDGRGRRRRGHRLPGARAPELRARRPRHGDRLRHAERSRDYFVRIAGQGIVGPGQPLLVDRFLDDAIEIDVDALYDGTELYIGGVMEHIEEAGIHSGDSSCTLPPVTLGRAEIDRVREATLRDRRGRRRARACSTCSSPSAPGVLYVLEANPRASRTVPFVSKALGIPLAKAASRIMVGRDDRRAHRRGHAARQSDGSRVPLDAPVAVKEAVLPFKRFRTKRGHHRRLGARPRDALDRRGHGHRPRLPDARSRRARTPRTAACRCRAPCSSRSPTATSAPIILPGAPPAAARLRRSSRPRAPPRSSRRNGIAGAVVQQVQRDAGRRRERNIVDLINARRDRHRREHPERPLGARRRLRDPRGGGRRRQGAVHDDRRALGAAVASLDAVRGGLRGQEPAGVRAPTGRRRRHDGDRDPVRRPARGARSPPTAASASASTRTRSCSTTWGLARLRRRARASSGCAWSRPRPAASASSSRRSRSSSATARPAIAALEDVLARRARRRPARDRRRQARRHRHDDRRVRRGLADARVAARGRRDDGQRLPGPRLARAGHGRRPRRRARALFVLAATSNPEAAAIQRASCSSRAAPGSTVAQAITQRRRSAGTRAERMPRRARSARSASCSARPPTCGRRHRHRRRVAPPGCRSSPPDSGTRAPSPAISAPGSARSRRGVIASESRSIAARRGPDGLADAIARRADEYGAAIA